MTSTNDTVTEIENFKLEYKICYTFCHQHSLKLPYVTTLILFIKTFILYYYLLFIPQDVVKGETGWQI